MLQKIIILFAFIGLVFLRAEKKCQDFLSYGLFDREQIIELVKEASLLEGGIAVSHGYFENDTELTIINKIPNRPNSSPITEIMKSVSLTGKYLNCV